MALPIVIEGYLVFTKNGTFRSCKKKPSLKANERMVVIKLMVNPAVFNPPLPVAEININGEVSVVKVKIDLEG